MANRWGNNGDSDKLCFWAPKSLQMVTQFSSVAQSCLILCDPMNCSMTCLPAHQQLPEFTQMSIELVMPSNYLTSVITFSSCPQSFPASRSFLMSQLFASGGQTIGVSASTSVLPMNTQDWSPLGRNGWISLQSKGFSRVFNNTVQKHQFFGTQLSFTSIPDYWKNHSLD